MLAANYIKIVITMITLHEFRQLCGLLKFFLQKPGSTIHFHFLDTFKTQFMVRFNCFILMFILILTSKCQRERFKISLYT